MKTNLLKLVPLLIAFVLTNESFAAGGLTLSWSDNSDNEDGFKIEAAKDGVTFEQIGEVGEDVAVFFHSIADEERAVVFTYRVKAFNVYGGSGYTETIDARRKDYEAPADPSNPKISVVIINAEIVNINQ